MPTDYADHVRDCSVPGCRAEAYAELSEKPLNPEDLGSYQSVCERHYHLALAAMKKALHLDRKPKRLSFEQRHPNFHAPPEEYRRAKKRIEELEKGHE